MGCRTCRNSSKPSAAKPDKRWSEPTHAESGSTSERQELKMGQFFEPAHQLLQSTIRLGIRTSIRIRIRIRIWLQPCRLGPRISQALAASFGNRLQQPTTD